MSTMQYEDVKVEYEKEDTPESHLLHVHIPDGFAREHIGAKVEYDFGRVRIFGERSLGNNKSRRFNERYQVPSYCDINRIRGKFDGKTVTITMPKIPGAVVPKQEELQSTEQETPEPTVQETQQNQAETEDHQEKANGAEVKDQKGHQEDTSDQDPKSTVESKGEPEATKESMAQKGQEEIHQKDEVTTQEATEESMAQKGQEQIHQKDEVTTQEATEESMAQKGQEEIHQKDEVTTPEATEESMAQKGQEEIHQKDEVTTQEATEESIPQKGQEGIPQKATVTSDAKLQTEENEEKQRIEREETEEDHPMKTEDSGKPSEEKKRKKEDSSPTPEKKRREEEGKGSDTVESSSLKNDDKDKGKEMVNGKFGDDADKKAMLESTRTRIKNMAASTSQALTSLAKSFNEEDKQKIIYMGAAAVVVALGVYASYKFRSSRRP